VGLFCPRLAAILVFYRSLADSCSAIGIGLGFVATTGAVLRKLQQFASMTECEPNWRFIVDENFRIAERRIFLMKVSMRRANWETVLQRGHASVS